MRYGFVFLFALGACASVPGGASVMPAEATILVDDRIIKSDRPTAVALGLNSSPTAVWPIVRKVYESFDIPVTVENHDSRMVGNANFFKSRQLAGQPMSNFVDCGTGMTGIKANSYRIYMSLLTVVASDGKGGTRLETTFVPAGQDISGGSSDRIPCSTSGRMEAMINEMVLKNVK